MSTNATNAPAPPETTGNDRIVLTLPGSPSLRGVATLVLGGIGSRIDLPYEKIDELQLAVLSVLGACELDSATIEIEIGEPGVLVSVGPLPDGTVGSPGLRTVLERLVDEVEPARRGAGDASAEWIVLRVARQPSG